MTRSTSRFAAVAAVAAALLVATDPGFAMRVNAWALYIHEDANGELDHHCQVHFPSGRVVDFGAMPLSFCRGLLNVINGIS